MRPLLPTLLLFAALNAPAAPGNAEANRGQINLPQERAAIEDYQSYDQRLQDIGWKLVRGNAPFCRDAVPSVGLQLQDMASYGKPQIARRALGLTGDFAVQTAAATSPAALSGAFTQNREITHIEGIDLNGWRAGKRFAWKRLTRAHDLLDETLAQSMGARITFGDGTNAQLEPVNVCPSRFELMGSGKKAVADGTRVVIGIEYPAFQYGEAEFAALIAHELAHNLLGHTAWLDRNGRSRRHTRLTEREADRLIPWLLVNAGYDPAAAARFFRQLKPHSGGLLFIRGTHPKWRERAQAVEEEIPLIQAVSQAVLTNESTAQASADWQTHFVREIDPAR